MRPVRIPPRFVERIWGVTDLSPWFPPPAEPTGEVWFDAPGSPLLIKFIYTREQLSIQVHPDDEYAQRNHRSQGKTEMWHILSAEPGARLGLGLRERTSTAELRAAIDSGRVEQLMNWHEVHPGETYFVEAHQIHAIGARLQLCEIQQNSDVTYRLYDYGRDRELHLEHGLAVCSTEPYQGRRELPVRSPFFHTELLDWSGRETCEAGADRFLVFLSGMGSLAGEPFRAGEVWQVPAGVEIAADAEPGTRLLQTYKPEA